MFDFAWSEIGLIAAVALILIGPKDMPVAIRTITDMIKKARRMASEFQGHVDEMMREANLGDVRDQISSIRNFDIRGELERHIDPDRSLRDTFAGNPLEPAKAQASVEAGAAPDGSAAGAEHEPIALTDAVSAGGAAAGTTGEAAEGTAETPEPGVPAFVPPGFAASPPAADTQSDAPAFIPPQAVLQRNARLSA